MKSGALKRGFGLVLLYIGVFALLVILQFGRTGGFMAKSGRLTVSAAWSTSERKGPPSQARIDFAGFSVSLAKSSPARILLSDGSTRNLALSGVEKIQGGARLLFEGGGELRAVADPATGNFKLSATKPRADATALLLPWSLTSRASFADDTATKSAFPLLRGGGGPYSFSFAGAALDRSAGSLRLSFEAADSSSLALRRVAAPTVAVKEPAPAKVLPQSPMDPAAYKAIVDGFVGKTWTGLSQARWDADRLAWKDATGVAAFSEKALAAYLAEAGARGAWADGYARAKSVASRNAASLTWLTTPYFGDTIEKMTLREAQDLTEVKRLTTLSQSADPAILEKDGLVRFLLDRSPWSVAQSALQVAGSFDATKLSVRGAIGYLSAAIEARVYLQDADDPFKATDAVSDRLIGALVKTNDGWFLKTEDDGAVDLRTSLSAGLDLVSWGQTSGKDVLVGVGESLVAGALGLADASGFLPARLAVKADGSTEASGSLPPEELYPLVASSEYYPREVSFYRDLGPGVWAFTCAPSIGLASTSTQAVFSVGFPQGYAHYMAIYGLKPFATIKLYGINYSPDSAFESYDVSGYLYRKASNALYLKMKHKQGTEKIELYY